MKKGCSFPQPNRNTPTFSRPILLFSADILKKGCTNRKPVRVRSSYKTLKALRRLYEGHPRYNTTPPFSLHVIAPPATVTSKEKLRPHHHHTTCQRPLDDCYRSRYRCPSSDALRTHTPPPTVTDMQRWHKERTTANGYRRQCKSKHSDGGRDRYTATEEERTVTT